MIFPLIVGIALGAVSVMFALQNDILVTVKFFSTQLQGSLALIVLLAMGMGILISLLIVLPEAIGNYLRYRRLLKANAILTEDVRKQKELTVFAQHTSVTAEDLEKLDRGVISAPSSTY